MNRLAILEDNLEFSRNLLNYIISRNKKIRLSSLAINAEEIMETINFLTEEDIILLDLGLPEINGLEVIDKLIQKNEPLPYIIVISGNQELYEQVRKYSNYIYAAIEKPFSFNRIVDMIEQITYETGQKCYEELVKEELRKFEMNVTTIGYTYIVDAISLSLEDEVLLKDMKNKLYKAISIKHSNVTTSNIKWAIEKCVKSTIRYTSSSVKREYFHVESKERISPKLFISTVVDNLRPKIEQEINTEKEKLYY